MSTEEHRAIMAELRAAMAETDRKFAEGWTVEEVNRGKGWEAKYPNLVGWKGDPFMSGTEDGAWRIDLLVRWRCEFNHFVTTKYKIAEKHVAHSNSQHIYYFVDEAVKDWNDEYGKEAILPFVNGWTGQDGWELRYPNIAGWIKQGKRHCIDINIDFVNGKSDAKVWYYDKSSGTETVLFKKEMEGLTELEVLVTIDEGLQSWMKQEGRKTLDYPW